MLGKKTLNSNHCEKVIQITGLGGGSVQLSNETLLRTEPSEVRQHCPALPPELAQAWRYAHALPEEEGP